MAHIINQDTDYDQATSAAVLSERLQPGRVEKFVEAVADIRQMEEYAAKVSSARRIAGLSGSKNFFYTATVMTSVVAALLEVDPDFFKDLKKYHRWLARHPEYRVGSRIGYVG